MLKLVGLERISTTKTSQYKAPLAKENGSLIKQIPLLCRVPLCVPLLGYSAKVSHAPYAPSVDVGFCLLGCGLFLSVDVSVDGQTSCQTLQPVVVYRLA